MFNNVRWSNGVECVGEIAKIGMTNKIPLSNGEHLRLIESQTMGWDMVGWYETRTTRRRCFCGRVMTNLSDISAELRGLI
jgi:hypothetical protein